MTLKIKCWTVASRRTLEHSDSVIGIFAKLTRLDTFFTSRSDALTGFCNVRSIKEGEGGKRRRAAEEGHYGRVKLLLSLKDTGLNANDDLG